MRYFLIVQASSFNRGDLRVGNFLQFGDTVHMICMARLDLIVDSNAQLLDLSRDHLKILWWTFALLYF